MSWSILSDKEIRELCEREVPMISPFVPRQEGKPSYGLGSFGYDIRLGRKFLVPLGGVNAVLDPLTSLRFPSGSTSVRASPRWSSSGDSAPCGPTGKRRPAESIRINRGSHPPPEGKLTHGSGGM